MPKQNKGQRRVKLNMEGVEGRMLVPEGDYLFKVAQVDYEMATTSGKPKLTWQVKVVKDDAGSTKMAGQKLYHTTSLQPQALFNLKNTLLAANYPVPSKAMELDLDKLEGLTFGGTVIHEMYDGKNRAKISDVFPWDDESPKGKADEDEEDEDEDEESEDESEEEEDEESEDEDDEDEEEEEDEPDLDSMNVKELTAYAKENGISLKKLPDADKKKAGKVRAFVLKKIAEED